MPDFTSALFLGLHHGAGGLGRWERLTTGRPAALGEPATALRVAARVARGHGAAAGVVHRSTLHALGDVVQLAAERSDVVLVDAGAYPLSELAAARATLCHGVRLVAYPHHDAAEAVRVAERAGGRPVVLVDGWCAGCNRVGPLVELEQLARRRGGLLVVDDTLALGVLGRRSPGSSPLGAGGGGTFPWLGAGPGSAVVVASLAKGYGAPLTVTSGPIEVVARLERSGTRVHSSQPTAVDLLAADAATGDEAGNERRRRKVARLVLALRAALRSLRLPVLGLPFPMVHTAARTARATHVLHSQLLQGGVRALLLAPRCLPMVTLSFAVTADHGMADVRAVTAVLSGADRVGVLS